MNGCRNMAMRQSICLLLLWILVLWNCGYVGAELRTIDFDHLPDGTAVGHATTITDAYAEWGVTFSCHGVFPDSPLVEDNNAYAYAGSLAFSGNNVIGGRILGDHYHWLNFDMCYGTAEFANPVDYISIYGAGSPFQVFYYDQHGKKRGPFASPGESFVDISPSTGLLIKKIEFGSYTGNYYTYFDDLTFNATWPTITVTDSIDPYDDLQVPFGSLTEGGLSEATVTMANDGDDGLIIGSIGTLAAPFSIETDSCSGETLGQGQSCSLTVRFSPTTTGTFNDFFDIPSNDQDANSVTIAVSGTGVPAGVEYTLTVNIVGQGGVTLEPEGGTYDAGTVVVLTTEADPGWTFDGFGGPGVPDPDVSTTTVTMDGDKVITAKFHIDGDADGVPDEDEWGPDGTDQNYDGNKDGLADSDQPHVVSVSVDTDGDGTDDYYCTIALPNDQHSFGTLQVGGIPSESVESVPEDIAFERGFFDFNIQLPPGERETAVGIFLPVDARPSTYWKYGPLPTEQRRCWYEFFYDGATGAEFEENVIWLNFVDGDRGDDDFNSTNSVIVDVGGPGFTTSPARSPNDDNTGGGGGGGSCFISTVKLGTLTRLNRYGSGRARTD